MTEILTALGFRAQRLAYRMAQRLMEWSGSAAAKEWAEARETRWQALKQYAVAEEKRLLAERTLRDFATTMKLVDGLLSTGQADRAQEQLRVALISLDRRI